MIGLDAAYTYYPTYAEVLKEYNRATPCPSSWPRRATSSSRTARSISCGDPCVVRRQEYWSLLSGAAGQFYGNHYTWPFADGWKDHLDTRQPSGRLPDEAVRGTPWFRLVPDQSHASSRAATARSRGTERPLEQLCDDAATPDGRFALSYLPAGGTFTLDLTRLAGVRLSGTTPPTALLLPFAATPFPTRPVTVEAPGANADGDRDWVLVLTAL